MNRARLHVAALCGILWIGLAVCAQPAFAGHVACGDVLTADTTLDGDLLDCPEDGLLVGADDVTIDLNGHTIDGTGITLAGPHWRGVLSARHDDVAIKNGTIQQFPGSAVDVQEATGVTIEDLLVRDSRGAIAVGRRSRDVLIQNNTLTGNGRAPYEGGIEVYEGFWFESETHRPSNQVVRGNRIIDNLSGIEVDTVDGAVIANNVLEGVVYGINVRGYQASLFGEPNYADDNLIQGNEAVGTGYDTGNVLALTRRNRVLGNSLSGFGHGLTIWGQETSVEENQVTANRVDGILITGSATASVVDRNVVRDNGDDGIVVASAQVTIIRNAAFHNGDWGIEAITGVIDGGGNRAWKNGQPDQCTGVTCASVPRRPWTVRP